MTGIARCRERMLRFYGGRGGGSARSRGNEALSPDRIFLGETSLHVTGIDARAILTGAGHGRNATGRRFNPRSSHRRRIDDTRRSGLRAPRSYEE